MRGHIFSGCLLFVFLGVFGLSVEVGAQNGALEKPLPNLQSLLDFARTQNPELLAMRLEAQAARERVLPAGSLADPRLRLELMDVTRMGTQNPSVFPGRVGSTKYTLMQDLPWPGKRDLKAQIASADAQVVQSRVEQLWQEVVAQIKLDYVQWYRATRQMELAKQSLDLMTRLEQIAQSRYAHGLAQQQDVLRAQLEQTAMRNELILLDSEASLMRIKINALLGRSLDAPLPAPQALPALPAAVKLDEAALRERVSAKNPQLFVEDARIVSAEKSRELTKKNRYPDITVGISPIQTQRSLREWELMLEVNLPLQQASRRAMERESESMLAAARARKAALQNQVLGELAEQVLGLASARQIEMQLSQSLLPQAELNLASALSSYENGKLDFATLLEAQQQIRMVRQNQIKAEVETHLRLVAIEKLLGEEV